MALYSVTGRRGISARNYANSSAGGYTFPIQGWPVESGTLSFWLGLPDDFTLPQEQRMPVIMGSDNFGVQLDLRPGTEQLYLQIGTGLATAIAYWQAEEKYHVAVSWHAAAGTVTLYLNGVQMAQGDYQATEPGEVFHLNSRGRSQGNYPTVLSELKIETITRREFPEVPAELREKIAACGGGLLARGRGPGVSARPVRQAGQPSKRGRRRNGQTQPQHEGTRASGAEVTANNLRHKELPTWKEQASFCLFSSCQSPPR